HTLHSRPTGAHCVMPVGSVATAALLLYLFVRARRRATLFPYTTLFRSRLASIAEWQAAINREGFDLRLYDWRPFASLSRSKPSRSEEHTSELQSLANLVYRLLLGKKKHVPPRYPDIYRPPSHLQLPRLG